MTKIFKTEIAVLVPNFFGYDEKEDRVIDKYTDFSYTCYIKSPNNTRYCASILNVSTEINITESIINDWCDQMDITIQQFIKTYDRLEIYINKRLKR